jgi:hypothetical protein
MNTLNKLSHLSIDQVNARCRQADLRFQAAAKDIYDRSRRKGPAPTVPSDLEPIKLPSLAPALAGLQLAFPASYGIRNPHGFWAASIHDTPELTQPQYVRAEQTPAEMVKTIRELDFLADHMEKLAIQYRKDTAAAIRRHAKNQHKAVKMLNQLCAE